MYVKLTQLTITNRYLYVFGISYTSMQYKAKWYYPFVYENEVFTDSPTAGATNAERAHSEIRISIKTPNIWCDKSMKTNFKIQFKLRLCMLN